MNLMPTHFAILGDEVMGTAIALLLAQKAGASGDALEPRERKMRGSSGGCGRENVDYLPGVPIPTGVELTTDIDLAATADMWIVAIPTVYLRRTLEPIVAHLRAKTPVLSLAKGVEMGTFLRPTTEIVRELLGDRPLAALSGPSHAEEVSRNLPDIRGCGRVGWRAAAACAAILPAPIASACTPIWTCSASSWAAR